MSLTSPQLVEFKSAWPWLFQTPIPPAFGVKRPSSRLVLPLKNCWTAQAVDKECPAVAQAASPAVVRWECLAWVGLGQTWGIHDLTKENADFMEDCGTLFRKCPVLLPWIRILSEKALDPSFNHGPNTSKCILCQNVFGSIGSYDIVMVYLLFCLKHRFDHRPHTTPNTFW